MQKYCGVNTSLYSSIDDELIPYLEQAIAWTDQGNYGEAEKLFEEELSSQRSLPVILLARAEWALKQFKVGVLYRILDEALSNPSVNHEEPEYRLMALIRAFAALSYKGDIRPGVDELERARVWLQDLDVSDYTDIHVRTIRTLV